MRNISKAEEQGKEITRKRPGLDIGVIEMKSLNDSFWEDVKDHSLSDAILRLIWRAYLVGLAVGVRNARNIRKKTH